MNNRHTSRPLQGLLTKVLVAVVALGVVAYVWTSYVSPAFERVSTAFEKVQTTGAR